MSAFQPKVKIAHSPEARTMPIRRRDGSPPCAFRGRGCQGARRGKAMRRAIGWARVRPNSGLEWKPLKSALLASSSRFSSRFQLGAIRGVRASASLKHAGESSEGRTLVGAGQSFVHPQIIGCILLNRCAVGFRALRQPCRRLLGRSILDTGQAKGSPAAPASAGRGASVSGRHGGSGARPHGAGPPAPGDPVPLQRVLDRLPRHGPTAERCYYGRP
jgi:hypothetical protein